MLRYIYVNITNPKGRILDRDTVRPTRGPGYTSRLFSSAVKCSYFLFSSVGSFRYSSVFYVRLLINR